MFACYWAGPARGVCWLCVLALLLRQHRVFGFAFLQPATVGCWARLMCFCFGTARVVDGMFCMFSIDKLIPRAAAAARLAG